MQTQGESNIPVSRLLAGAARVIASVRYGWLLTAARTEWLSARPMGRLQRDLEEEDWRLRFVADGRSRKIRELQRAGEAAVIIQDGNDAFVSLMGASTLHGDTALASQLMSKSFELHFPSEEDRSHATVIEIDTRQMDLWIRGVTPEPFGVRPARLARDAKRVWHLLCDEA